MTSNSSTLLWWKQRGARARRLHIPTPFLHPRDLSPFGRQCMNAWLMGYRHQNNAIRNHRRPGSKLA